MSTSIKAFQTALAEATQIEASSATAVQYRAVDLIAERVGRDTDYSEDSVAVHIAEAFHIYSTNGGTGFGVDVRKAEGQFAARMRGLVWLGGFADRLTGLSNANHLGKFLWLADRSAADEAMARVESAEVGSLSQTNCRNIAAGRDADVSAPIVPTIDPEDDEATDDAEGPVDVGLAPIDPIGLADQLLMAIADANPLTVNPDELDRILADCVKQVGVLAVARSEALADENAMAGR